jgi:tetratricopeptide (TPR) repeat protein
MKCAYRMGLALLVNLAIVSGGILPGVAEPIGPTIAQAERSNELEAAIDEGNRLLKAGDKESLIAAISQFEQALHLSQVTDKKAKRALVLLALGQTQHTLGELSKDPNKPIKALELYYEALSIWQSLGDQLGEANALTNIATVYDVLGDKTEAEKGHYKNEASKNYHKALKIWRALGNQLMEATIHKRLGDISFVLRYNSAALASYNEALLISRFMGDRAMEAAMLHDIVHIYSVMEEPAKILENYSQILSVHQATGDRLGEATVLKRIGNLYAILGQRAKTFEYYSQALPIWQALGDRPGEATMLSNK